MLVRINDAWRCSNEREQVRARLAPGEVPGDAKDARETMDRQRTRHGPWQHRPEAAPTDDESGRHPGTARAAHSECRAGNDLADSSASWSGPYRFLAGDFE